ncbi:MAG: aldo/keto reductase [Bacilli bacterium]|jgi:diketogulonate reductase-like aldo/keto reductase|nr:aldo/keto reductase [Bacilli bacterium]
MENIKMNNGITIPIMALGTWEATKLDGYESCLFALQNGYTHIDTARIYNNEEEVGQAIKDSKKDRSELFITSKLWNNVGTYSEAKRAFNATLERLGLDYLDLYLIHWPNPLLHRDHWQSRNAEVWRALEDLYEEGKIKAIGVSNFMIHHLEELKKTQNIAPMVNQIRLCPGDTKEELVNYCFNNNIVVEAYSPFARGEVFESAQLRAIAISHDKTVSQIVLRWCYQKNYVSLPKSITPVRILENLDIFNFTLNDQEIKYIDEIKTTYNMDSNEPDKIDF